VTENYLTVDLSLPQSSEIRSMFKAIERVLPEDLIAEFDGLVQAEDMMQWSYGDKTNQIWSAVSAKKLKNKKGKPYTFLDICFFVSVRFLRQTRSFNTVKTWALVCRRYSPVVRQLYNYEDIWFAHFAYAAKKIFDVDDTNGKKKWQNVLSFSYNQSLRQGYTVSVQQLESYFEGRKKNKSNFAPTVHDFALADIDLSPIDVNQVATIQSDADTLEGEFGEAIHRLGGIVTRISAKYPIIGGSVNQAYAVLSNALRVIVSPKEEEIV